MLRDFAARVYHTDRYFISQAVEVFGVAGALQMGVGDVCRAFQKKNVGISTRSYYGRAYFGPGALQNQQALLAFIQGWLILMCE